MWRMSLVTILINISIIKSSLRLLLQLILYKQDEMVLHPLQLYQVTRAIAEQLNS